MLAKILALAVGFGSLALYIVAFFFPEVHRKNDFIWSGIGLFYALVLWFCAGRITGAVLLGQMAGVALFGWFGWQTMTLRRLVTSVAEQTKISTQKSTPDQTQEQSTAIPQALSTPEVETIPKPNENDLAATSIQELENVASEDFVNEVKSTEAESELISSEIISEENERIKEFEVDTTTNTTEEDVLTGAKTVSETPQKSETSLLKQGAGFSQLLTPVTDILSNIKNAIQGKDSQDPESNSGSTKKSN